MADFNTNIAFLKDASRYPKINRREITHPRNQIGGEEYNRIVDTLSQVKDYSKEVSDAIKEMIQQGLISINMPIFLVKEDDYDKMESTGAVLADGIYLTYETVTQVQKDIVSYDDERGVVFVEGSLYDEENEYLSLPNATYDDNTGYVRLYYGGASKSEYEEESGIMKQRGMTYDEDNGYVNLKGTYNEETNTIKI